MLTKATKNLICKIKIFYLYMKSLALLFVNLLTKITQMKIVENKDYIEL
jgi:hypothetical protein